MKRYFVLLILLAFLLTGCITVIPGQSQTDPNGGKSTEPSAEATKPTGWVKEAGQTYYIGEDGNRHTGWLELNNTRYYLDSNGVLQTGWLELDGKTYYLKTDGSIARGKLVLDNRAYYFTSTGARIIVANPWNIIPSDYTPDLVVAESGHRVDSSCRDDLIKMLTDCRAAGFDAQIADAYRTREDQIYLYNRKVNYYLDLGYSPADARKEAATISAMPGTSEHEMGLAVDLVDSSYWVLDEAQENTPAQKWLIQHSWEYGFILRYPTGKTEFTGIIYEPWHYRYVGKELAKELHDLDLCLEEYLANLS